MIADAVAAAERDDWSACLTALLAAWRLHRQPELAKLVERVGARVAAPPVRPEGRVIEARVAVATEADVSELVATIHRQLRTHAKVIAHAVALATVREADPRIATVLAAYAPFNELDSQLDLAVVQALDAIDDPRYRLLIISCADALAPRRGRLIRRRPRIDAVVAIAAAVRARRPPPSIPPSLRTAIEGIEAALARPRPAAADRSALLAAIYREPENLAARLVYADALLDQGDVRGELITLQCSRDPEATPTSRERTLLKDHERSWLGAIEPHLLKKHLVYRRGFVTEAHLAGRGLDHPRAEPEWQTLEQLDLGSMWGPEVCGWLTSLPNLRRVTNLYADDISHVIAHGPVAWTALGLRYFKPSACRQLVAGRAAFPDLRELAVHASEVSDETLRSLVGLPIERLRVLTRGRSGELLAAILRGAKDAGISTLVLAPASASQTSIAISGTHAAIEVARPDYITGVIGGLPEQTIITYSTKQTLDHELAAWFAARGIKQVASPGASSRGA